MSAKGIAIALILIFSVSGFQAWLVRKELDRAIELCVPAVLTYRPVNLSSLPDEEFYRRYSATYDPVEEFKLCIHGEMRP